MLNLLKFTKDPSLARLDSDRALFVAASSTMPAASRPRDSLPELLHKADVGIATEIAVVSASSQLLELEIPPTQPSSLQDKVRLARSRLIQSYLRDRTILLDTQRGHIEGLRAALTARVVPR